MNIAALLVESVFKYGPALISTLSSIWQDKEHGSITIEEAEKRIQAVLDFAERQKKLDDAAVMEAIR